MSQESKRTKIFNTSLNWVTALRAKRINMSKNHKNK